MGATADERFYKRKLNEFDQELKRLQKELAKLKILKREGGRARKHLVRSMQREMELQAVLEQEEAEKLIDLQVVEKNENRPCCKKCNSRMINTFEAGSRTIIVCQDCESRYSISNPIAEIA